MASIALSHLKCLSNKTTKWYKPLTNTWICIHKAVIYIFLLGFNKDLKKLIILHVSVWEKKINTAFLCMLFRLYSPILRKIPFLNYSDHCNYNLIWFEINLPCYKYMFYLPQLFIFFGVNSKFYGLCPFWTVMSTYI